MKLREMLGFTPDPTLRHKAVEMNISDLGDQDNWSVYAGKRLIRTGVSKQQADEMTRSKTLSDKFGKLTVQRAK